MRKCYLFLATMIGFFSAQAQVSLDIADFPATGQSLDVILFNPSYPGLDDSVSIGSAGAAGVYDFSSIDSFVLDTTVRMYNNPDTFGWAAAHPSANVTEFIGVNLDTITGADTVQKTYHHYLSSSTGLEYIGGTYILDLSYLGGFGIGGLTDTIHPIHTISDTLVDTAWALGYSRMDSSYWQGVVATFPVLVTHFEWNVKTYEVDGEGTLTTATGSYPCLRVKITDILTAVDSTGGAEDSRTVDTTRTYQYWAKGVGWAICELDMNSTWDSIWFGELVYVAPPVATLDDLNELEIKAFPNPVSDILRVESAENNLVQGKLINMIGQEMQAFKWPEGHSHLELDLGEIPRGHYFLRLDTKTGESVHLKIYKQ